MESSLRPIDHYIATSSGMLSAREQVLDEVFLSNPIVVAQRIQREYVKLCLQNPQILLPSTLIL